jgi:hypothetical protein
MKPSQPDDAGSRSQPEQKPVPPAVVYTLDCLQHATPAQVNRHLLALGYTAAEANDALRQAQDLDDDRPSAWSPDDATARRCMTLGFLLFLCGVVAGCMRMVLMPQLPAGAPVALSVFTWLCILAGIAVFWIGIAQMRIRRN